MISSNFTQGLSSQESKKRIKEFGFNEIVDKNQRTPLKIFIQQFTNNSIIYILLFAGICSALINKYETAYVISFVICLVIFVGFILEYKAEKAILELKKMITQFSTVVRDGVEIQVPSREITIGDILILKSGEYIPADAELFESKEVTINESSLTGESKEISKVARESESQISEENKVYMGTYMLSGKCRAQVTQIGMNTKFGKIAGLIETAEKELPLQKNINQITKYMIGIAITMSLISGMLLYFSRNNVNTIEIVILIIAICVSAVPEGLPLVMVTTLASGATRMAKKNAIVNKMAAIGSLGEITTICSDKTGTITKGEMTVQKIYINNKKFDVSGVGYSLPGEVTHNKNSLSNEDQDSIHKLAKAALLCNDSKLVTTSDHETFEFTGSPTEAALLILGKKLQTDKEDFGVERIEEIPFSSVRKVMSIVTSENEVYCKGAPEVILKMSTKIIKDGKVVPLSHTARADILSDIQNLTNDAYRVLSFSYKQEHNSNRSDIESELIYIGSVGIDDPPRDEVKAAIQTCDKAGIRVLMITGDNKETAIAVAKKVGLEATAVEGDELDKIDEEQLRSLVKRVSVYSRVRPEHKVRIVRALKSNGEIVAMTGDGVNDAPSLKEAHIGIAMGKGGTDVTRAVADITLKDDNFATIISAIHEGRGIFENIRTFVSYQLSCNLGQITLLFLGNIGGILFGWETPLLLAIQILFVNLVTDNIPSITLGLMKPSKDIMNQKPHRLGLITKPVYIRIIGAGLATTFFLLGLYHVLFSVVVLDHDVIQTILFITFISIAIALAINFKASNKSIYSQFSKENALLFMAAFLSVGITVLVMYNPYLKQIFGLHQIEMKYWLFPIAGMIGVTSVLEILKGMTHKIIHKQNL